MPVDSQLYVQILYSTTAVPIGVEIRYYLWILIIIDEMQILGMNSLYFVQDRCDLCLVLVSPSATSLDPLDNIGMKFEEHTQTEDTRTTLRTLRNFSGDDDDDGVVL